MKRSKKNKYYVIFALPEQHGRPGTVYYSVDATITDIKSRAAKFLTFKDAEDFAKEHNIELTSATYLGLETFD
jgi:hypothetical protein